MCYSFYVEITSILIRTKPQNHVVVHRAGTYRGCFNQNRIVEFPQLVSLQGSANAVIVLHEKLSSRILTNHCRVPTASNTTFFLNSSNNDRTGLFSLLSATESEASNSSHQKLYCRSIHYNPFLQNTTTTL